MSDPSNQVVAAAPPAPATTATTTNPMPTTNGPLTRAAHWIEGALHIGETAAQAVVTPAPLAPAGSFQATVDALVSHEITTLLSQVPLIAEADAALQALGVPFTLESLATTGATNAVAAVFDHLGAVTDRQPAPSDRSGGAGRSG